MIWNVLDAWKRCSLVNIQAWKCRIWGFKRWSFRPPGGAKEPRWAERVCEWHQGRGEHPELAPAHPVCSRGAGAAGPRLHPVCDPGGSEQLQGDGSVRTLSTTTGPNPSCYPWSLSGLGSFFFSVSGKFLLYYSPFIFSYMLIILI